MSNVEAFDAIKIVQSIELPFASTALNVFYARWEPGDGVSPMSDVEATLVAQDWMQALYGVLAPMLYHNLMVGQARQYRNSEPMGQPAIWEPISTFDTGQAGEDSSSNQMIAHGVAAVMRVVGTAASVISRKYFPGLTETWISAGKWTSDAITNLGTALVIWMSKRDVTEPAGKLVPGTWSTRGNQFVPFSLTGFVSMYAGYQRRRKPGVGM